MEVLRLSCRRASTQARITVDILNGWIATPTRGPKSFISVSTTGVGAADTNSWQCSRQCGSAL